jgi:transcription elongation factor Elf1
MIRFHCPHCNESLKTDDEHAGDETECPTCGQGFVIPAPAQSSDEDTQFLTSDQVKKHKKK